MSKVIPMNIEAGDLPEHPLLRFAGDAIQAAYCHHFSGVPEWRAMEKVGPTRDELRDRWSRMNMHEGGIEWDGPLPNWAPGLKVTEEE